MAQKRAGETVAVSASLEKKDLTALKREAAARRKLVEMLGGPTMTPQSAAAIDAEQRGGPRYEPKKSARAR